MSEFEHSADFRSVNWLGQPFHFTPMQAAAVEVLWDAWEHGLALSWDEVLALARMTTRTGERQRVRTLKASQLFRRSPAWKSMIVEVKRGLYSLSPAKQICHPSVTHQFIHGLPSIAIISGSTDLEVTHDNQHGRRAC